MYVYFAYRESTLQSFLILYFAVITCLLEPGGEKKTGSVTVML